MTTGGKARKQMPEHQARQKQQSSLEPEPTLGWLQRKQCCRALAKDARDETAAVAEEARKAPRNSMARTKGNLRPIETKQRRLNALQTSPCEMAHLPLPVRRTSSVCSV